MNKIQKQGEMIHAKIQAKVWRGQMKGKNYNTVVKELIKKLKIKYPELNIAEIKQISIGVI